MKFFAIPVLLLSTFYMSPAQEKSILFIGNTQTSDNQMPQTVQKMIDERKIKMKIEQVTADGSTLTGHAKFRVDQKSSGNSMRVKKRETTPAVEKILSKSWTAVILQESTIPVLIPEQRKYWVAPAIIYFDSLIRARNGKTIFYQNYALQEYPQKYCFTYGPSDAIFRRMAFDPGQRMELPANAACSDSFLSSGNEFAVFKKEQDSLATKIGASVAEVGHYFELCKQQHPEIQLYVGAGDSHPSKEGSYLIACVFFKALTKDSLKEITYSAGIDKVTSRKLRELVESGVD